MAKQINEKPIIDYYLNNTTSISKMAKMDQFPSEPTISKILKKNNIEIIKNPLKTPLPVEEVNELYQQGKTSAELAKFYKCSRETIRKLIKHPRNYSETNLARSQAVLNKISESCKQKWDDPEYRSNVHKGMNTKTFIDNHSNKSKKNWKNPEYREKQRLTTSTKEYKEKQSTTAKNTWKNPEYREKQKPHYNWRTHKATKASIESLKTPQKREQWISKIKINNVNHRANQPRISMQQRQLYYLLEQSGIDFHPEGEKTKISDFYIVDCIIPQYNLIIEVQGEYWHNLDKTIIKDKQKKTFIKNNTNYKLLYLNELDFKSFSMLERKLEQFKIKLSTIICKVTDLTIQRITEQDAKLFFETFHYTSSIRKGALTFGAFYGNNLISAISYTPPIRREVATNLDCKLNQVKEISRLAIASNLNCKNTASWFISKTIKMLPDEIDTIVSYSDATYGHIGTVYKASNFVQDRIVENNYHYENQYGDKFHKKTIWDRAKQFKASEPTYAQKHGLYRVLDAPKLRFVRRI